MSNTTIDAKDFRRALSQFATGVTVITTRDESGQAVGVTASSFNSVSIDPPLILWSIDKKANSLQAFKQADHFSVNVLSNNQAAISNNFASRGIDKFNNAQHYDGIEGCPLLEGCIAQFECERWAIYEGGDHLILIGQVIDYRYNDHHEPLIFAQGGYASPIPLPSADTSTTKKKDHNSDGFISEYLLYLLRKSLQSFSTKLYSSLKLNCDTPPEEWRIFATMVTQQIIEIKDLAKMVMQPEITLREIVSLMINKGHLAYQNNDNTVLKITNKGLILAKEMQKIAQHIESQELSQLSDDQIQDFKNALKKIAN